MTISKFIGLSVGVLALAGAAFVPSLASAQTATTTGLLNVYVQVLNQTGSSYVPANFTVTVTGQNPSPSSFQGSLSGTLVSLAAGSYNATVPNQYGFTASYSQGCQNTIVAGQTQTCLITMSAHYQYPPSYPYPYPYPQQQNLTCTPAYQTIPAGRTATFTAQGGIGGTYNWFTNGRTYANVGPSFSTVIENSGSQLVTVTNGAQTATCSVTVSVTGGYFPNYPVYPNYTTPSTVSPTYTYTYVPRLPNTGFEPQSAAGFAFAVVLLLGAGFATMPYVRKAFATAVR